jgi:hypothetical protein
MMFTAYTESVDVDVSVHVDVVEELQSRSDEGRVAKHTFPPLRLVLGSCRRREYGRNRT